MGFSRREGSVSEGLDALHNLMNTPYLFEASAGGPNFRAYNVADAAITKSLSTIKTPDHAEMKACAEVAGAMALGVTVFRSTISKLETLCDGFATQAAAMLKTEVPVKGDGRGSHGFSDREAKGLAQRFYTAAPRMFVKEPAAFAAEQLRIAGNVLSYLHASMAQYKRKPEAKPEFTPGGQRAIAA
jgi:hypothetical protein